MKLLSKSVLAGTACLLLMGANAYAAPPPPAPNLVVTPAQVTLVYTHKDATINIANNGPGSAGVAYEVKLHDGKVPMLKNLTIISNTCGQKLSPITPNTCTIEIALKTAVAVGQTTMYVYGLNTSKTANPVVINVG